MSEDAYPKVPLRNEGQRRLRLIHESDNAIGARLGVTRIIVNHYRTGKNRPSIEKRRKLHDLYGIAIGDWDLAPQSTALIGRNSKGEATPSKRPPAPRTSAPSMAGADVDIDDPTDAAYVAEEERRRLIRLGDKQSEPLPDTRTGIEQLLRSLRAARNNPEILPNDRVKLATAETRAFTILEKMDKDNAMSEDRIIKNHPKWLKMRKTIGEALTPFPDAAKAVITALKALEMAE